MPPSDIPPHLAAFNELRQAETLAEAVMVGVRLFDIAEAYARDLDAARNELDALADAGEDL